MTIPTYSELVSSRNNQGHMQDITRILADLAPIDGQPMTTSRLVATRFKKRHKNVLQSIQRIEAAQPEFSRLNFQPVEYMDEKGEMRPEYRMTRDGFALLAMGFTGEEAMSFKIAYIGAFNVMAEQIAEALSFRAASDAAKIMRARKGEKPALVQQLEMMREAVQLCLQLGLTKLPELP